MGHIRLWFIGALVAASVGCGTTRMTDTQRTATEQLLVSNAVDQAVSQMDFKHLAGKPVFFDAQYLDGVVDRGYLVSSLRQHLLANGCLLQEDRNKADFVVEARSGGVGTNRNSVLVGVPQMNIPTFVPGQPSFIPEIPLAKKTDQEGVAKIAVFAFNRRNGNPVWQSGVVQSNSNAKDRWVLGAGPFQQGTIRNGTQFAGEPLNIPTFGAKGDAPEAVASTKVGVTDAAVWQEFSPTPTQTKRIGTLTSLGPAIEPLNIEAPGPVVPSGNNVNESRIDRGTPYNLLRKSDTPTEALSAPPPFSPPPPESVKPGNTDKPLTLPALSPSFSPPTVPMVNNGGHDETQPSKIVTAGFTSAATEPPMETASKEPGSLMGPPAPGPAPVPLIDPMNWYGTKPKR